MAENLTQPLDVCRPASASRDTASADHSQSAHPGQPRESNDRPTGADSAVDRRAGGRPLPRTSVGAAPRHIITPAPTVTLAVCRAGMCSAVLRDHRGQEARAMPDTAMV